MKIFFRSLFEIIKNNSLFTAWRASRYLIFLIFFFFFQKIWHNVLHLKIQLILSILWMWHLKLGPKSNKWSESIIPITRLYRKKAQIEQNIIIVFIESWKEIELWFWFIWIARWLFLIVEVGPKNWNFVYIPCLCKNSSFSKCFK